MADADSCLLCLERICDPTAKIYIGSTEGKSLNVQRTLDKYFNELIGAGFLSSKVCMLCRQCWDSVFTFHQFCLRVKRAHTVVVDVLQSNEAMTVKAEPIKLEDALNEQLSPPPTRRRGRPRRKTGPSANRKIDSDLDKTQLAVTTDPVHLPSTEKETRLNELAVGDIKHEALREEPIDANFCSTGENFENVVEPLSPKDQLDGDEPQVELKKKAEKDSEKVEMVKGRFSTKELDDIIAQHFKLSCCLCDSALSNFTKLYTHFRVQHDRRGYALCCGRKFFKRTWLVDHIRTHQDPEYFKCPTCGKVSANQYCLQMHLKTHESADKRTYQCDVCSKRFSHRVSFDRHALTHVPEDQRHHACPQCEKTFPDNFTMTQHLRLVHLKIYVKICDVCGKSIRGRDALQRHMDEHAGVTSGPFKCNVCGTSISTKYGLATHVKRMHTEKYQTPQTCPICQKESPSVHAHYRHMKYMHTLERSHACTICTKAFRYHTELKKHMARHIGGNVYTCTFCPKTFNSSAPMYAHRQKMHPKEYEEHRLQKLQELQLKKQIKL